MSTYITYPIKEEKRLSMMHMASYISIGTVTLITLSSLFCLFLVIKVMDDCVRLISPVNLFQGHIDWTQLVDTLSRQLTHFAEWEKNKRYFNHSIDDRDKLQELISTVTTFMNNYVDQKKRKK